MEAPIKSIFFLLFLVFLATAGCNGVEGAGACGTRPEKELFKLYPCIEAAQDKRASVSSKCCDQVRKTSATCLCAIVLSDTAKRAGVKPEAAVTIPKRCKIVKRPVGHKCGAYTVP